MIELRALGALELRGPDRPAIDALLRQPKRIALLIYLVIASPRGFQRRDTLLTLFWPELDQEHARASLRSALTVLRGALGDGAVTSRGSEEVGLDQAVLWSDVDAFETALDRRQFSLALELYRGDLLAGFHVPDSPEFERWLDHERERLRRAAAQSAWSETERLERDGHASLAVECARRAAALAPYDEPSLRKLMSLLDRIGDRAGAVVAFEQFADRIRADLDIVPSPDTTALVAEIRSRTQPNQVRVRPDVVHAERGRPEPEHVKRWPVSRVIWAGVGATVIAVMVSVWLGTRGNGGDPTAGSMRRLPYTIVTLVEGSADVGARDATRRLLTTALDESGAVYTLPEDQLRYGLQLAQKPPSTPLDLNTARELAIRGSIRTIVTGTLDRVGRTYAISVRVLDVDSGTAVVAVHAIARDSDEVIPALDGVMREVARALGTRSNTIAPTRPLQYAITSSFDAYQKYAQGRSFLEAGADEEALPLFKEAIALDSGFGEGWRSLASCYSNLGYYDSARVAYDEAIKRHSGFTQRQRLLAEHQILVAWGEDSASLVPLERAVRDFGVPPTNLAISFNFFGRPAEAVELMEQWDRRAPFGARPMDLQNEALWLASLARYDEAREKISHVAGDNGMRLRALTATAEGQWAAAESLASNLLQRTAPLGQRRELLSVLASSQAAQGRTAEAFATLHEARALALRQDLQAFRDVSHSLLTLHLVTGIVPDTATLRVLVADTSARTWAFTALWAVAIGDTLRARRALAIAKRMPQGWRWRLEGHLALANAWIAAAGHRWGDVEQLLKPVAFRRRRPGPAINQMLRWTMADAYERLGELDSAAAYFEDLASWKTYSSFELADHGLTHLFAHRRLVLLYAQMGRLEDARRHWTVLADARKGADPRTAALLEDARSALIRHEQKLSRR